MAGLAEACTHVAAFLFWVKMAIKIHYSKTVTDKQAYWASPSNSGAFLQPEMLINIDFRSPQFKKSIEKHINSSSTVAKDGLNSPPLKRRSPLVKVTSSEMDIFFENLMKSDKKSAILRILPGYTEKFRPKSLDTPCKSLKNLYSNSCLNMPFQYLQEKMQWNFWIDLNFPGRGYWILKVK